MAKQINISSQSQSIDVSLETKTINVGLAPKSNISVDVQSRSNVNLVVSRSAAPGVNQIIAGDNIVITPTNGIGTVTIDVVSPIPTANYATYAGTANTANVANIANTSNFANLANVANRANIANVANIAIRATDANHADVAAVAMFINGQYVAGTVANANYATYAGTIVNSAQPNVTSTGNLTQLRLAPGSTVTNELVPSLSSVFDLGESGKRWRELYLSGNGIHIGGVRIISEPGPGTTINIDTYGNAIFPEWVVANNFSGNGSLLSNLNAANLVGGVPLAETANIALSVSGSNITGPIFASGGIQGGGPIGSPSGGEGQSGPFSDLFLSGTISLNTAMLRQRDGGIELLNDGPYIGNASGLTNIPAANVTGLLTINTFNDLRIKGGNPGEVLTSTGDGDGNLYWGAGGSGNGVPGGADTYVQFNDGGVFGGDSRFTFVPSNGYLDAPYFRGDGSQLTSVSVYGWNVSGEVANATYATSAGSTEQSNYANIANSVSGANVGGEVANATYATSAGSVAGANVIGEVANANYAIYSSLTEQSNYANIANSVSGSNVSGEVANATYATSAGSTEQSNYANIANSVSGSNVSGEVANATYATYSGISYSVDVANVSGIGNIATINIDGNASNILYGNGIFAAAPNVENSNSANYANYANFAGEAYSVSGSNVVGEVANATYAVTAGSTEQSNYANIANSVSGSNVSGEVANATYATNAGYVTEPIQSNITSVGTLTSLEVSGNINGNVISATQFRAGNGASETVGYSFTGEPEQDTGMYSESAGNITFYNNAIETLYLYSDNSAKFTGNLIANSIIPSANVTHDLGSSTQRFKDLYLSGSTIYLGDVQLSASTGELTLPNANITTDLIVGGNSTIAGNLTVSGNIEYTNVNNLYIKDPLIEIGGAANNQPLSSNDGKDRGELLHYYTTEPVDAFIGWDNSNGEFALGSNVSTTDNVVTFNTFGNLRAQHIYANINGSNVVGDTSGANHANIADVANSVAGANVTGTVANATYAVTAGSTDQSNYANIANSVSGANVSGTVANATYAVTAGSTDQSNYANIANSVAGGNVSGAVAYATTANSVAGANVSGSVAQSNYANIANSVAGANVSGQVSFAAVANSVAGSNVTGTVANATYATTAGTATSATTATTATTAGTVTTAAQGNITSVGTLTSLDSSGTITASRFVSNVATGTAPFSVSSGTLVANLFVARANISSFIVPVADASNVTNQQVYFGASANGSIRYDSNFTYNPNTDVLNVGNSITFGSNITGPQIISNIATGTVPFIVTSTTRVANLNVATAGVADSATTATTAGTVTTAAQPNITSTGTLTGLVSGGVVDFTTTSNVTLGSVSNLHISGGTSGYVLSTNGTGTLSWVAQSGGGGGGTPGGNTTELQFNNAGSFGGIAGVTYATGNLTLGAVSNVKITGGSSNLFVRTDGAGNLSFEAITSNLTVGTRSTAVNIGITNYTMNVAARTGNVTVNVN